MKVIEICEQIKEAKTEKEVEKLGLFLLEKIDKAYNEGISDAIYVVSDEISVELEKELFEYKR